MKYEWAVQAQLMLQYNEQAQCHWQAGKHLGFCRSRT